jgi:hypothetical protein
MDKGMEEWRRGRYFNLKEWEGERKEVGRECW